MSSTVQVSIPGCGTVQGVQVDTQPTVAKFLNIPYATVPERWRLAVKAVPWTGVRDASEQGPVCHQPKSANPLVSMTGINVDEDDEEAYSKVFNEEHCLNLNIFAPKDQLNNKSRPLIPVMVWIHGGGYKDGSNALELYNSTNLVAHSIKNVGHPVIVVTINYRLNYFGFLSSPELVHDVQSDTRLSSNGHEKSVGNWGLLDQKMALEWVRDHIEAFGGNPKEITAFGESAGSASIGYHLSIPAHHGLFQRAIMQSGASTTMTTGRAELEGQRYFRQLCQHFEKLGVIDPNLSGAEKLARLRKIPGKDIAAAGNNGKIGMFVPTIDNVLIHGDVREWIHDSSRYDPNVKAVMLGDCRDEGSMFVPELGASSLKKWPRFVTRYCPPGEEREFEAIYGTPQTDADAVRISGNVLSDTVFLYPIHATTLALMDSTESSHRKEPLELARYHFDRPLDIVEPMGLGLGAHHAVELPFVFGPDVCLDMFSDVEKALSLRVQELWILFAWGVTSRQYGLKHGFNSILPAGVGEAKKEAIVFTEEGAVEKTHVERLDGRKLAFWRRCEAWSKKQREELARQRQGKAKL
ncbi:MAG: Alpha/Beta hydrolase protein [Benniella sp.]|nr:MAG: Alpha/Beta hydrolase protein [Benniella sp.]